MLRARIAWVLLLTGFSAGCGSEPDPEAYTCERDPALLRQTVSCFGTAMCPCGTRCEYGLCSYDCETDAQCGEGRSCDPFGRCSLGAPGLSVGSGSDEHFFVVRPSALRFADGDREQPVVVRLGEGGSALTLQVDALSEAYRVACPSDPQRFGERCSLALDRDRPSAVLRVQRLDGVEVDETKALLRIGGPGRARVLSLETGRPVETPQAMAGAYEGRAMIDGVQSPEVGRVGIAPSSAVPVRVWIGEEEGGRAPIAIEDPFGFFGSPVADAHPIVGYIERSGEHVGFLPVGRYAWADVRHPRLSEARIAASITDIASVRRSGIQLGFELAQAISVGPEPWRVRWRFELELSGALDGPLQQPQALPPMGDPEAWVREPSPLEAQFVAALGAAASVETALCSEPGRVRGFADRLAQLNARLDGRPAADYAYFDGDVGCEVEEGLPTRWPLLPLYGRASFNGGDQELALVSCLAELDGDPGQEEFPCIELDRWLGATGLGLEQARMRALGEVSSADVPSERVGAYLVTRLLDLFGFLDEVERSRAQVRSRLELGDPLPSEFPTSIGYLAASNRNWDLLLHPRIFETLRALHPGALLNPDYRLDHARRDVEVIHRLDLDLHATPLFVALMSHLADRSVLWSDLAGELARGEHLGSEAERLRRLLTEGARRGLLASLLAWELQARAESNRQDPLPDRWVAEMEAAARRFAQAMGEVAEQLEQRPLQADELGLPWFRVGDQTGASARSRAMSDFMLGTGESLGGVVGAELSRTRTARNEAIAAFAKARSENLSLLATTMWQNAYQDQLSLSLGSRAVDLCGYDRNRYDAKGGYAILTTSDEPDRCFVDDREACAATPPRPEAAALKLCRAAHHALRSGVGPFEELRWLEGLPAELESFFSAAEVEVSPNSVRMRVPERLDEVEVSAAALNGFAAYSISRGEPASFLAEVEAVCSRVYDRHRAEVPSDACVVDYAAQEVEHHPDCDGLAEDARAFGELDPSCFRGELGLAALAIRDAQLDVLQASAELEALIGSFSAEVGACEIQLGVLEQKSELYEAFLSLMETLRKERRQLTQAIAGLEAVAACLNATKDLAGDGVGLFQIGHAAGICAANAAKAAAQSKLAVIEEEIGIAGEELSAELDLLSTEASVQTCFQLLEARVAQLAPASVRIRSAVARYGERLVEFEQKQAILQRVQDEARIWSSRLQQIKLAAVPQDYAYHARFATYASALEALRRSILYAGRAVEFELQRSLLDGELLRRTHELDELEALARRLQSEVISGRVGAGQSNETRLVSSLRDDILRLPRPDSQPPGFHRLPSGLALAEVLSSRQNAVFGADGTYLGQRVRFALAPTGAGRGEAGVANQLGGAVCAERVWRVGAVVVGEDAVGISDSGLTRMFLRKRNGFYARRCDGEGAVEGFVSPASFGLGDEPRPDLVAIDRYSQALLNGSVYRADFPSGARQAIEQRELNPETSGELAGLGLYGDYELFIPAESLGDRALRLRGVEDILLVFELVLATTE